MEDCKANVRNSKFGLRTGGRGKSRPALLHIVGHLSTSITGPWLVICLLTLLVRRTRMDLNPASRTLAREFQSSLMLCSSAICVRHVCLSFLR